jgi:CHAT domain-containing protein
VGDPTDDLRGAKDEAEEIAKTLLQVGCEVDLLLGSKQATAKEFVIKVRNQNYDIIHYAGHGYFDPNTPLLSGLLFDDGPVFAEELERVINSRVFVFLSACDAGFTKSAESNVGFIGEFIEGIATSVMIGGAIGCLGPMWKIGDDIAKEFALSFYQFILEGNPIGEAVRQARIHAREIGANNFWKSWVLYGDPLQSFSFDKKNN